MPGNDKFKAYATSTAFSFSLSKNMIDLLLYSEHATNAELPSVDKVMWHIGAITHMSTLQSLIRRGLVETTLIPDQSVGIMPRMEPKLTEAGAHMCRLLRCAGFNYQPIEYGPVEDIERVVLDKPLVKVKE